MITSLKITRLLGSLVTLALLGTGAIAQSGSLVPTAGFNGAGLGSRAGAALGLDLTVQRGKLEFASRSSFDLANKVGSLAGGSFSERLVARWGDHFVIGGGLGVFHTSGAFGSRTSVAPLIQGGWHYRKEPVELLLYGTVRPWEWGSNYTRDHHTRGVEMGLELRKRLRSRLVLLAAAGFETLSFTNVSETRQRSGGYVFARSGVGWVW